MLKLSNLSIPTGVIEEHSYCCRDEPEVTKDSESDDDDNNPVQPDQACEKCHNLSLENRNLKIKVPN